MTGQIPGSQVATGDTASPLRTRYSFLAPPDLWVIKALLGLISDYNTAGTWYQEGTATPEEAAALFGEIFSSLGVDMATVGVIVPYGGGILPSGWLPCDGRSLLRSAYPNLFAAIGTVWGSVDATHFNIPDLRGKTLVGQGTNPNTGTTFNLGTYGGEEKHAPIAEEMAIHTHVDSGHNHGVVVAAPNATTIGPGAPQPTAVPAASLTQLGQADILNSGGGMSFNIMQTYGVVNWAIIT